MNDLTQKEKLYTQLHLDQNIQLLKTLTEIPSQTFHEQKRASFCMQWLHEIGANAYMDEVYNVICPIDGQNNDSMIVFMAHNDIAFPDIQTIQVQQKGNRLYAPGIGDDTANIVNMLMTIQYLIKMKLKPVYKLLFVINSCEEGLGNSLGCQKIIDEYHLQIKEFISFDGYLNECTCQAVGSKRYKIEVTTKGGHSYADFGQDNAIEYIAKIINDLSQVNLPDSGKTTYNFGQVGGGRAINVIADNAYVTYEFRSSHPDCIKAMDQSFHEIIDTYQKNHLKIHVKKLGYRPAQGSISQQEMNDFTQRNLAIIKQFYHEEIKLCENSTDSNIPLSYGICANTIGTIIGGQAHTYDEWIDINSIPIGFQVAMALVLQYIDKDSRI